MTLYERMIHCTDRVEAMKILHIYTCILLNGIGEAMEYDKEFLENAFSGEKILKEYANFVDEILEFEE